MDELNVKLIQQFPDKETGLFMTNETDDLGSKLMDDLGKLGLPTDFTLEVKGYSKCYHGRYTPNKKRVIIYSLNSKGKRLPYVELLKTTMHEALHHYQWTHVKGFVRKRGVMHNTQFKRLEQHYLEGIRDMYAKA